MLPRSILDERIVAILREAKISSGDMGVSGNFVLPVLTFKGTPAALHYVQPLPGQVHQGYGLPQVCSLRSSIRPFAVSTHWGAT